MIKEFLYHKSINKNALKYNAGTVRCYDGNFIIGYEERGAEETFSIGQPVFDRNKNLLGFLGIGMFAYLEHSFKFNGQKIPVYHWTICLPTEHCRDGKQVFTYWQNFNKTEKRAE